jgi:conjugal transfer pilus assembly protein TraK
MNKICLVLALLLANSCQTEAAQILLQGAPTESTTATVSRNEPNLLKVEGRKIKRIYGAEGLFTVTPEAETGVAWLKPLTDKALMSIFITDDTGQHFKLLLKVEDIPAETIIIRSKNKLVQNSASTKNEPRNEEILRTIMALYAGEGDAKNELIPLWKGVRFESVNAIELRGLRGDSYLLSNISDKQIVMDEREFYRDGVQAVSIQKLVLEAGESTSVFVVSESE